MTVRILQHYPVLGFFALTFAISWGGVLWVIAAFGIPTTPQALAQHLPIAIFAMLAGPSVAGLLSIAAAEGVAGLRRLRGELARVRVGVRWYALALLAAPLVSGAVQAAFTLASPAFAPGVLGDRSRLGFGLVAGLVVGVLEELGWTGFAVPRLLPRYGVLKTGLAVGVVWGAWHVLGQVVFASGTYAGTLSAPIFFAARTLGLVLGVLPAFRVLLVWLYARTSSVSLAMLMHASLTATTMILEPRGIAGATLLVYGFVGDLTFWGVVALLVSSGWMAPRSSASTTSG